MGIEVALFYFVSVEPRCDYFVNKSFVSFKCYDEIITEEKSCVCIYWWSIQLDFKLKKERIYWIEIHNIKQNSILYRSGLRSLGTLLPVLGATWLFGILAVNKYADFFQYLFIIANSLQVSVDWRISAV